MYFPVTISIIISKIILHHVQHDDSIIRHLHDQYHPQLQHVHHCYHEHHQFIIITIVSSFTLPSLPSHHHHHCRPVPVTITSRILSISGYFPSFATEVSGIEWCDTYMTITFDRLQIFAICLHPWMRRIHTRRTVPIAMSHSFWFKNCNQKTAIRFIALVCGFHFDPMSCVLEVLIASVEAAFDDAEEKLVFCNNKNCTNMFSLKSCVDIYPYIREIYNIYA